MASAAGPSSTGVGKEAVRPGTRQRHADRRLTHTALEARLRSLEEGEVLGLDDLVGGRCAD
ncbi:MAG TPA: hypothetical protein VGO32_08440, partial [Candidatus Limnocylindria bacterium]|nr:hypothetical protein [Candidatus Limnocylindria bacterium]